MTALSLLYDCLTTVMTAQNKCPMTALQLPEDFPIQVPQDCLTTAQNDCPTHRRLPVDFMMTA